MLGQRGKEERVRGKCLHTQRKLIEVGSSSCLGNVGYAQTEEEEGLRDRQDDKFRQESKSSLLKE